MQLSPVHQFAFIAPLRAGLFASRLHNAGYAFVKGDYGRFEVGVNNASGIGRPA
jgi:hypothetical protein